MSRSQGSSPSRRSKARINWQGLDAQSFYVNQHEHNISSPSLHFVNGFVEVACCYGKSCNAKTIQNIMDRTIKADVKLILDTLDAGGNPEDLMLKGIAKIAGTRQSPNLRSSSIYAHHFFFLSS
jgi:hypothetical protein